MLLAGLSGAPVVLSAGTASAAAQIGPAQTGPAQIGAMGRPDPCWQAAGNGAPVTLARCDSALQAQQWA